MATLNANFLKLKAGYLFPEIARRVRVYTEQNPDKAARIIRCGIGDVTEPLPPAVVEAMHEGVDEMADRATFNKKFEDARRVHPDMDARAFAAFLTNSADAVVRAAATFR